MLNKIKQVASVLAIMASFASAGVIAKETLSVGVDTAFVPFEFKQGDKYVGFDIDLWEAIAKKMDVDYQMQPMDFSGLIPGLQSGNLDVAMAGITITAERQKAADFSAPYYDADLLIAVPEKDNATHKISDLTGKKVGLKQGTSGAAYMDKHIKATYVKFPNIDNAYLDLEAGNLDAVVHDAPNMLYYIKVSGHGKIKAVGDDQVLDPMQYGFALQKGSPYTLRINDAMAELKTDGTYQQLYRKWFDKDPK